MMQTKWPWFERKFNFDFPAEKMPDIIQRLRGTPVRVEDSISEIRLDALDKRENDSSWSIKENIGHLAVLEPLWSGRIQDIIAGQEVMRDADLSNQATFDGNFNAHGIDGLLDSFRSLRNDLVQVASTLDVEKWSAAALHPRLKLPMRVVDLCQFVADHDDYHLARIHYLAELLDP